MQNNLFFNTYFCIHNNRKRTIKINRTIYLSLSVLFPFVPLYWNHESWVQKDQKFVHDTAKKGLASNQYFSMKIRPIRMVLSFTKFYSSIWKELYSLISTGNGNEIQVDNIYVAPKFGFSKRDIPTNNALSLKKFHC